MKHLVLPLILLTALPGSLRAQEADPAAQVAQAQANEQRLRDTLRTTTQQLRTAETEKATLLAGQAERDEKIAALEAQVATLTKRANDDKTQADQSITNLKTSLLRQEQEVARLGNTLDKWKKAYQQAASTVKISEAARARLDAANMALERKVTDRETKNLELYRTAREILERYAGFSLGRALAAREPFTGIAKAKIEEQIQGYSDKLEDSKLKPVASDGKPSTQPAPAPAKPAPPRPDADGRRKF